LRVTCCQYSQPANVNFSGAQTLDEFAAEKTKTQNSAATHSPRTDFDKLSIRNHNIY
jgi:hypothetical protein